MRYRISGNISFSEPNIHLRSTLAEIYLDPATCIILKDNGSGREFIINSTTKAFIQKFSYPKNLDEVTNDIAEEVNASGAVLTQIVEPFFNYMKQRRFIVPEHCREETPESLQLFNTNSLLDDLTIIKIIDVSASNDVYRAVENTSQNELIVKVLKYPGRRSLHDFRREFDILACLNKTGVSPKAHAFHLRNDYAYFTQDYIDGSSLPQFLNPDKAPTLHGMVNLFFEIVKSFTKIHAKAIVHGDVHPSNIMVTKENRIKVIDFGLSIRQELETDQLVNFGGAYFYMPPERIGRTTSRKFTKKPDYLSDVYQLGMVLYTMLYDKFPFNGLTWEQLAREIKTTEILFPVKSHFNAFVPGWLKDIIKKCLAKKPADRFDNARELYLTLVKNMKRNGN